MRTKAGWELYICFTYKWLHKPSICDSNSELGKTTIVHCTWHCFSFLFHHSVRNGRIQHRHDGNLSRIKFGSCKGKTKSLNWIRNPSQILTFDTWNRYQEGVHKTDQKRSSHSSNQNRPSRSSQSGNTLVYFVQYYETQGL